MNRQQHKRFHAIWQDLICRMNDKKPVTYQQADQLCCTYGITNNRFAASNKKGTVYLYAVAVEIYDHQQ